jgi:hypothetical protein
MKTFIAAIAVCCGLALPAAAKTYELPDANPAVSVTLPGKWKPSTVEHGVEATSDDEETYVAVETATAKGVEALIDDDVQFLVDQGVTIKKASQQTHDTTINGMPCSFISWSGTDKDGPTSVTLVIFGVTDNLVLLMTAWSSPAGDKANGAELEKIVSSIKRR